MKKIHPSALGAVFGLLMVNAVVMAADTAPAPGQLHKVWAFMPKSGSQVEFEKAFAAHVQWRRDNKDPWTWQVYVEVDGPNAGLHYARSGNHHWSDFDDYDASEFATKANAHWNTTVAPHLAKISSWMGEDQAAISHWPEDAPDYQLFQLYTYRLKPGHMQRFMDATTSIVEALKEAKWPYHWSFIEHLTGSSVPSVMLVLPATKWADMKEPSPNVLEAVAGVRGKEKAAALFAAMSETFAQTDAVVVRLLPHYGVKGAQ
jgi:hypothetical protein